MTIDTMDKVVAALAAAQTLQFYKTSVALEAVGVLSSLWTAAGMPASVRGPRAQRLGKQSERCGGVSHD